MFVVTVAFEIRPGCEDRFNELVRTQARNSLAREAECHQFDVCIDPEDSSKIFLYEVYANKAAFEAHLASGHFKDFNSTTQDLVRDKQVSTLQRIEP